MKASDAMRIKVAVMEVIRSYASVAQGWDIEDEDDFNDFDESLIDVIMERGNA